MWKDGFTEIVHVSLNIGVRVPIQSFKGHSHETALYNFQCHPTLPQSYEGRKSRKIVTNVRGRKHPKEVSRKIGVMLTVILRIERVVKFIR